MTDDAARLLPTEPPRDHPVAPGAPDAVPDAAGQDAQDDQLAAKVGSSARILLTRRLVTMVLFATSTAVLARVLGVEQFGIYSSALASLYICLALAEFGFGTVVLRDLGGAGDDAKRLLWTGIRTMSAWAIVPALVLVGLAISAGIDDERGQALLLLAPLMFASGFTLLRHVFLVRYETAALARLDIGLAVVQSVALVSVGVAGGGVLGVTATMALTTLLVTVVVGIRGARLMGAGRPARTGHVKMLRTAVPIGLASVVTTAYFSIDLVLLGFLVDDQQLGLYSSGVKVLNILVIIPTTIVGATLPGLSEANVGGPESLGRLAARAWHWLLAAALPVCVGVAVFSDQVVLVAFGDDYEAAGVVMRILALGAIAAMLASLLGTLLIVVKRPGLQLFLVASTLALNVAGNLVFVPEYGIEASAWATLATELFACVCTLFVLRHHVSVGPALRVTVGPVGAAVLASAVGLALLSWQPAVAVLAWTIVYAGSMLVLKAWPPEMGALRRRTAAATPAAAAAPE